MDINEVIRLDQHRDYQGPQNFDYFLNTWPPEEEIKSMQTNSHLLTLVYGFFYPEDG
jgi:hypothetical protein